MQLSIKETTFPFHQVIDPESTIVFIRKEFGKREEKSRKETKKETNEENGFQTEKKPLGDRRAPLRVLDTCYTRSQVAEKEANTVNMSRESCVMDQFYLTK